MHLAELAPDLDLDPRIGATEVAGLTADSRAVRTGYLFAALPGAKTDGARFVPAAMEAGAAAILAGTESMVDTADAVPVLRVGDPRHVLALMAARFFHRQPETMVAVTGTSGKTSVAEFTRQIWQAAGRASASVGTLGVTTAKGAKYGSLTTPDPVLLHKLLAELADEGITFGAMEASSHGLDQCRLDGVRLKAAAFTNLGRDHMDYHTDTEDYFRAKLRLFERVLPEDGIAVVDPGEAYADRVAAAAEARGIKVFSVGRSGADLRLVDAAVEGFGQRLVLEAGGARHEVLLPLAGKFQVSNALTAAGLAIATGVAPEAAIAALATLKGAPGRLDLVGETADGALCFVDYAHKPDAITNALAALRPFASERLIIIVGAGGDRDSGKRPLMGKAATEGADIVIVTDDNPRSEDPATIRRAILEAAPGASEIGDRREAIRRGVSLLQAGDILLVAGKGHEPGQIVGDKVLPFSDHDEVRAALQETSR
ncbi:UDP-N-acetylmuramoyl-L-alanyl-D-glutamate--2,6-diaminopimelate ligase [Rhodobium gokarnense]|uniref:UDP-N-acetylmuramoyl-L-alanyl-D-glutamate--2,6-diaminopimelate ligase n=1 Tax=Rhodobium gokarnense TaxID=364296 RepID=A0ABT3H9K7_9HYPH|nr:UDP-N-acetylmuramoyl-L-alanyl-D-glutamate--2,6-diaminopimelate ligase [Rhodobium gokarnense]MCW2307039.1 UDP-N-acetylmuramoyl-L-alanyl-D-glutamate--2,6-diaminopimelate ligase [Rhodobium gokarnense]